MARPRASAALGAHVAPPPSADVGEPDDAYHAYDAQPADVPDEWGDLASFRAAADRS